MRLLSQHGKVSVRQRARQGVRKKQEEVEGGRCAVRETVNDKMRVNFSCDLTIKKMLIMQRSCEHWLKWVILVTEGFTQLQFS